MSSRVKVAEHPLVRALVEASGAKLVLPPAATDYARLQVGKQTIAWVIVREKSGYIRPQRLRHTLADAPAAVRRGVEESKPGVVLVTEKNVAAAGRFLAWAAGKAGA